jgi:periplasmic protein CpxP/Spy
VSDHENTDSNDNARCTRRHARRRRGGLLALFLVAGVLGALLIVPAAIAGGRMAAGMGHCGPRGWHGDAEVTEEGVRDHLGFAADRMLSRVDATDDQRDQVDAILDDLAPALLAQKLDGEGLHEQLKTALTAEVVDAEALEGLRVDGLAHADETSALVLDSVVAIGQVLTPEQRGELVELAERFHGRR